MSNRRPASVARTSPPLTHFNVLVPERYRRGHVLLRAGTEGWIAAATGAPYSHAGVCVDEVKELAVDAHPVDSHRETGNEVARLPIHDFFSKEHAPGGGDVYEFVGPPEVGERAASWAEGETGKPYTFELMDPILDSGGAVVENNQLYCSELVWRAYKNGGGVLLVDPKDFINLLAPERVDETIRAILPIARDQVDAPSWVPDVIIRRRLEKEMRKRHNGRFIAPAQLALSPMMKKVHSIRGGAHMDAPPERKPL